MFDWHRTAGAGHDGDRWLRVETGPEESYYTMYKFTEASVAHRSIIIDSQTYRTVDRKSWETGYIFSSFSSHQFIVNRHAEIFSHQSTIDLLMDALFAQSHTFFGDFNSLELLLYFENWILRVNWVGYGRTDTVCVCVCAYTFTEQPRSAVSYLTFVLVYNQVRVRRTTLLSSRRIYLFGPT